MTPLRISFDSRAPKTETLVVFAAEGGKLLDGAKAADKKTKGAVKRIMSVEKFEGKKGQTLIVTAPPGTSHTHVIVIGLGKIEELKGQDFERLGSGLTGTLNSRKISSAQILFETKGFTVDISEAASRFATGASLSSYRFDKYMTKEPKDKKPTLKSLSVTVPSPAAARALFAVQQKRIDAVFMTRDLVSEVPNVLYPESFANIIKKELSPHGIAVNILHMKDLEKLGMGALVAVGKGSVREPKLVTMEYRGGDKNQKNIAFVGKGVTFDTGGISIKPGAGMEEMKWDMAGAGAVVGLMRTLAARKAKVNVIGVVALAENMPSGNAYRPGDIVTSMSGQTIEVHNTDAEGRLILCDALWYVQEKYQPTHIVDLATLTGAILVALGHEYAGLFSNDDDLAHNLGAAGKATGELLWRMPLNDAWNKQIDAFQADMKNISGGREAGSSIGAHFLQRFIKKGVKWAHLDIAGTAWTNKDRVSVPKGASAFGVRLLDQYVTDNWEK